MNQVKFFYGLGLGLVLGVGGGVMIGIVMFPFWFPPPEVNEQVVGRTASEIVARAEFIHADPDDALHYGRGSAEIYPDLVHLAADFEVGPGPKYHVYLVPETTITPDTPVAETMFVDLGRLKSFSGSQNYAIPPGVNLADYPNLVIWCEQFSQLISPAAIRLE